MVVVVQVERYGQEARSIDKRLKNAQELTRKFNSRELLFGVPPTDYSRLKKLVEFFEPFFYLWNAGDTWGRSHNSWMNDPFETLDPSDVDTQVTGWWKGLFKTQREFNKREMPAHAANCEVIREQVILSLPVALLVLRWVSFYSFW